MIHSSIVPRHLLLISSLALASGVAACGGSTPAATSADGSKKSFDEMSSSERMKLMKTEVVPQMSDVFRNFDEDEFATVSCPTCHGPGAKDGDFDMPSASLPALDQEEMEEHPAMTAFMKEKVVPTMAGILGLAPYNPETHEGFGCFNCHTHKESE